MPSLEAAVAAWIMWPEEPVGWKRHIVKGRPNEYPGGGGGAR
jgi:hypothetical protein